jgi:uncharacterized membrane protein
MIFVYFFVAVSLVVRLNPRRVLLAALLLLILILVVTPLSSQMTSLADAENVVLDTFIGAVRRVALGNGITNIEVMQFLDDGRLQFGWGVIHWEKLLTALPGITVGVPFSSQVQMIRNPFAKTAFSSMTYLGILYADFGAFGVIIGYLLIGVVLAWEHTILFNMRKTILKLPALAFAILYSTDLSIGSSVSVIASLVIVTLFYFSLRLLVWVQEVPNRRASTSPLLVRTGAMRGRFSRGFRNV